MPGLAPFRALEMAVTHSSAAVVLSGMDGPGPADAAQDARIASVPADSFEALFGLQGDSRLPIAFLSNFDCPNCRVLDAILTDCDAANPGTFSIVRQELPLLGAALRTASKAGDSVRMATAQYTNVRCARVW